MHVDVVQQFAALVNVHLRVNVANMRLRSIGANHELVRDVVHRVAARHELQNRALALRELEFHDHRVANLLGIVLRSGRRGYVNNVAFAAHKRNKRQRYKAHKEQRCGLNEYVPNALNVLVQNSPNFAD